MTASMSVVFLGNILKLKVCFKKLLVLKTQGLQKEGLQRNKDSKGKMNDDLLKSANIWSITKFLQSAEAASQRYSIKSVFKNFPKFTGKSICQNEHCRWFPVDFMQFLRTSTL